MVRVAGNQPRGVAGGHVELFRPRTSSVVSFILSAGQLLGFAVRGLVTIVVITVSFLGYKWCVLFPHFSVPIYYNSDPF